MIHLLLERLTDTGEETMGRMRIEGRSVPMFYTVERPWKDNQRQISCIPRGTYKIVPHTGTKFKNVYRLLNVTGRTAILIHSGNTVADVIGCIAIGNIPGTLKGHPAVLESCIAMDKLRDIIGNNEASITIW